MAKFDIKKSKKNKIIEKVSNVIPFNSKPIVIPRDKLEAAHLKVKQEKEKNKKMKISLGILLIIITILIIKGK